MNKNKFKQGIPLWFIVFALWKNKFKSLKRFLIYIFHISGYLNLKKKKSIEYTNEDISSILMIFYDKKIKKKEIYKLTQCTKNTFNKKLYQFLKDNNLDKRRSFTINEYSKILTEWQGENKWGMNDAISKRRLAEILHNKNYKKLYNEFSIFFGEEKYKNTDKFSPKEVKLFLEHIDLNDSNKEEKLLGYEYFKNYSFIMFTFFWCLILWNSNNYGIKYKYLKMKKSNFLLKIPKLFSLLYLILTLKFKNKKLHST